jgi:hypothetical protein
MSDSDSGGSSSTRLSVFKGGVNDSYPHYRIKLISLFKQKGLYFLIVRDLEANPTLFVGEDYERKIITASNIIVQSLGRTPLSIVEEFLESPGQMLEALDNRYRGATTTDIILSLSEIHNKVFSEENDMSTFLDEMGSLFANLKAMKCGFARYRSGWATPGKDSENKFAPCSSSFIEVDGSQATHLGARGKSFSCRA